jgi:hypothetical protein
VQPSVKMIMRAVSLWPKRATLARTNEGQQQEQDGASENRGKRNSGKGESGKHTTTRRSEKARAQESEGARK